MSENQNRRVVEKTDKERLDDYEKMVGVVSHKDWAIIEEYFKDALQIHQHSVDYAESWEAYLYSRAIRDYIKGTLLQLPENLRADRDAIEDRINNPEVDEGTNPLED